MNPLLKTPSRRRVYAAVYNGIWSFRRDDFRRFCEARARGETEGEGDPDITGRRCVEMLSYDERTMHRRGFPPRTDGAPRFNVTDWERAMYEGAAKALADGTFDDWSRGR